MLYFDPQLGVDESFGVASRYGAVNVSDNEMFGLAIEENAELDFNIKCGHKVGGRISSLKATIN